MYTYIIVDDEVIIRQGLQIKISQTPSLQVTCVGEASNGLEAFDLMKKVNPDFVITDMKMNKMDGTALLEKISQEYPGTPVIVISGYKLFDYVKQAIEKHAVGYVLKPFSAEEIASQVKKAIELLENQKRISKLQQEVKFLEQEKNRQILFQAITRPWNQEIEKFVREKGYPFSDNIMLLTITAENPEFRAGLYQICNPLIQRHCCNIVDNHTLKTQFYILLHMPENQRGLLAAAEKRLSPQITDLAGKFHLFLCVSRIENSVEKLNQLYSENNALLQNVFLTDQVKILYPDDRVGWEPVSNENEIHDLICCMKYYPAKVDTILSASFQKIDAEKHPFGSIKDFCKSLTDKVNAYAIKNHVEVSNIMEQFYPRYLFCGDMKIIEADFSKYIHAIFSSIHLKENDQGVLLQGIISYIDKNYRKKLTLQQIAEEFYISPSFCSNLLKENLGMTFNDYLSKIRLQNAKRLLVETRLSVNKISDEVGYSNPKYFFKVFKKLSGYTPLKYRSMSNTETRE